MYCRVLLGGEDTMPIKEIVKDSKKYAGKYVAIETFWSTEVICSGKSAITVKRTAERKGVEEPVVFFVPVSSMAHIY